MKIDSEGVDVGFSKCFEDIQFCYGKDSKLYLSWKDLISYLESFHFDE